MGGPNTPALFQKSSDATNDQAPKPLTIKQLKDYPESSRKVVLPGPTSQGNVSVGANRGRSFSLHYKIYGSGPTKILWLCGHGDEITSWHRYIREFCVPNGAKYTSLFIQPRGVKESEGPFGLWSTKDLAADALDLLDRLKWTEKRSFHVVGHSMGGMQAQQLARLCSSRIDSLNLLSTTSNWMADQSLMNAAKSTLSMFIPRSEAQKIAQAKATFFGRAWPGEPDEEAIFPTNGDNWIARDYMSLDISYWGAILQMPACVGHRVDLQDLKKLAHEIGGSRIQVMHGTLDNIIPFGAGQKLYAALGGEECGVQFHAFKDTGHILKTERFLAVVKLLEAMIASTSSLEEGEATHTA